jgi:hypothetical protein
VRPALFFLTTELQQLTNWIRQSTQSWGYGIDLSAITPTQVAIGIAVILLVILAIGIDLATRKRRTVKLRAPLGDPDAAYVRAVKETPSLRQTEALPAERLERAERPQRVLALHILPLAPGDRARFLESWGRVQSRFIDGPGSAVADADQLLGDVLSTRGYPVSERGPGAADISVDHPHVLENYRAAHQGSLWRAEGQSSTEDLRQVMIQYRTLFEELVGESGAALP